MTDKVTSKDLVSRLLAPKLESGEALRKLRREAAERIEALSTVLERYMFAYPAFRMKPIGEPGSPARIESERLMALEELAQKILSGEAL